MNRHDSIGACGIRLEPLHHTMRPRAGQSNPLAEWARLRKLRPTRGSDSHTPLLDIHTDT